MNRNQRLVVVERAIGDRSLVWFGVRGDDAATLLPLPQFESSFAITAPLGAAKLADDETLESLTCSRVDLDTYDIDLDTRPVVGELRRTMLAALNSQSVLVAYRPSRFLSAIHFASLETAEYLGQFRDRQAGFEHKPWVETQLRKVGVRTLPWTYVAEEHRQILNSYLENGASVLRASQTSGGVGFLLVERPDEFDGGWLAQPDAIISVAPFFDRATPLNVTGCIFPDGTVTLQPGSVQLIGIPMCTKRRFGYCGNDFARFGELPRPVIDNVDAVARTVGRWLAEQNYIGAFGVDFLLDGKTLYFTALNPRLPGSVAFLAMLCADAGYIDILLDHISAFLGLSVGHEPQARMSLHDWRSELPAAAQVIVYNASSTAVRLASPALLVPAGDTAARVELAPEPDVQVESNAAMFRVVFPESVTETGFELRRGQESVVAAMVGAFGAEDGQATR